MPALISLGLDRDAGQDCPWLLLWSGWVWAVRGRAGWDSSQRRTVLEKLLVPEGRRRRSLHSIQHLQEKRFVSARSDSASLGYLLTMHMVAIGWPQASFLNYLPCIRRVIPPS